MSQVGIATIGGKLVDLLNAGDFSQEFTAEFKVRPIVELTDATLHVYVVPKRRTTDTDGKSFDRLERGLNIAVQKKLVQGDDEITDLDLLTLSEEIEDWVRLHANRTLVIDTKKIFFRKIETDLLFAPDLLRNSDEFLSVATATYFGLE